LERFRKFPEAETSLRRTEELKREQSAQSPSNTMLRHTIAMTYVELAVVLNAQGQKKDGSEMATKVLAIWRRLVAEFPVSFGQLNGYFMERAHFVITDYFNSLDPPNKTEEQLRSAVTV